MAASVPAVPIRPATSADVPRIVELVVELASYEREPDAVRLTPPMLHEALFGADAVARCHVATAADEVVGIALWFRSFSTWVGRPGIYLEDLYVTPEHRGRGLGKALLQTLADYAVSHDYGRMEWAVLDWNAPAIGFYHSLGASPNDGWTTLRLTGQPLAQLASSRHGRDDRDG